MKPAIAATAAPTSPPMTGWLFKIFFPAKYPGIPATPARISPPIPIPGLAAEAPGPGGIGMFDEAGFVEFGLAE